ncbi:hypothetical protein POSPLADRAFT_1063499 [Postia placenta MAD-698-R-SB12]|uniref:Uncharacterized protein n=1 Tax=Postia placenta MAD-698-R-SB12 TaxID=670580 RepID=A0A1X6MHH5_9APHY|nr:hypothetical protein POSPLADRAFT_1063499 [Postia placenta MAD-698-R-SB12]OSX55805.1 hypothetical protein POSPLADRAFT_1063499 [Postia placenta MAD-698-R-SB12]
MSKAKANPLPLGDALRDLALLRASDCDLSSVLPPASPSSAEASSVGTDENTRAVHESVAKSYEFVREARAVIKLLDRGVVDRQGGRVEDVRARLEDVGRGLDGHGNT